MKCKICDIEKTIAKYWCAVEDGEKAYPICLFCYSLYNVGQLDSFASGWYEDDHKVVKDAVKDEVKIMTCKVCAYETTTSHTWFDDRDVKKKYTICDHCFDLLDSNELNQLAANWYENEHKVKGVVKPNHYTWIPGIECKVVTSHFNFNLGNVIKYVWRAGKKDSSTLLEDLQKCREYINYEIAKVESESKMS